MTITYSHRHFTQSKQLLVSRLVQLPHLTFPATFHLLWVKRVEQAKASREQIDMIESTNIVVVQQPMAGDAPQQLREWNSGVFGCCSDCGSCICGLLCLPCLVCNVSSRLNEHCLAGYCSLVALRTKLRLMGGIQGGVCNDGICVALFGSCVVCQMDRELKYLGR
ncbi:Placenta-specific gene 8 protein [Lamellibrachia satsuma]|nr:Placenta-specific gene 8 protein [Lamellibrachia satsuma]